MNFFSKLGHVYTAQNNLQRVVSQKVRRYDNLLVDDPQDLVNHITNMVLSVNQNNPRCKPLEVHFDNKPGHKGDLTIRVTDLVTVTLYPVEGKLETGKPMIQKTPAPQGVQLTLL